jgi:hypothetical protein
MKTKIFLGATIALAILTACGGSSSTNNNVNKHSNNQSSGQPDVYAYPKYTLSQENKNDIAYMGNEERLAYDVYTYLYNFHLNNGTTIKQLSNIANNSETRHIETVRDLVKKYNLSPSDLTNLDSSNAPVASSTTPQDELPSGEYDINHIQELYNALVAKGENSTKDALEVGCMVEVTDINDLNPKIDNAIASGAEDLQVAFEFLRSGSYNHYWAFDKGLKNLGISDGCCALGSEWCHPEYPQE